MKQNPSLKAIEPFHCVWFFCTTTLKKKNLFKFKNKKVLMKNQPSLSGNTDAIVR